MVKNLDEETGEQFKTIIIGGKKVKVPVLFVLPEEYGEKEIETYEHPEVNIGKAAESKEEPLDKLTDGKLEEVEKEPQPSQQNIRDEGQAILDQKVPDTKIGAPPKQSQISLDTAIANKINALAIQVKVNGLVAKKDDWDDKERDLDDAHRGRHRRRGGSGGNKKDRKSGGTKKDEYDDRVDRMVESGLRDEINEAPEGIKNLDDESLHHEPASGDYKGRHVDIDAEVDNKTGRKVNVTPSRVVGTNPKGSDSLESNPFSALSNDARYSDGSESQTISQRNADKWKAWLAKKEEEQTTFDDEENTDPLHAEAKKKKKEVWDKARRGGIGMTWDSQGKKIQ